MGAIYPLSQKGWVQLVYPTASRTFSSLDSSQFSPAKTPKIVAIHHDLTNFQVSKATFSQYQQKVEVVFLDDAQNTLGYIFEIKPDLIFCDLVPSSSTLDGYDFCAMLRRVVRLLATRNYCQWRSRLIYATHQSPNVWSYRVFGCPS